MMLVSLPKRVTDNSLLVGSYLNLRRQPPRAWRRSFGKGDVALANADWDWLIRANILTVHEIRERVTLWSFYEEVDKTRGVLA